MEISNGEVLYRTVDRANGDEYAAAIQGVEHGLQVPRQQISFVASPMEPCGQRDEAQHDEELEDQGCLEEIPPYVLFALRKTGI